MSGHNKWSQIKHKKAAADQVRAKLFSKLANNITIAARSGADPKFNSVLKSAIDQAKKQNMPQANIDRAIGRAADTNVLDALVIEIYGPEGVGIIVDVATDSRNRTIGELRALLKSYNAKIAEQGSLMWSFDKTQDGYVPKFKPVASPETRDKIKALFEELSNRSDVLGVYSAIDIYS